MNKEILEFEALMSFGAAISLLRQDFPEFAKEIDRMHFDVGRNHLDQCGHAMCDCQTMTFEDFHNKRNAYFARAGKEEKL